VITLAKFLGIIFLIAASYTANEGINEIKYRKIYEADEYLSSTILSSQPISKKLGYLTTRKILTQCLVTFSSRWFDLLSEDKRTDISKNCEKLSTEIILAEKRHSEAHLILAYAALKAANIDVVQEHLESSAIFAPVDRFNVEWRLLIAHEAFEENQDQIVYNRCTYDLGLLFKNSKNSPVLSNLINKKSSVLEKCI